MNDITHPGKHTHCFEIDSEEIFFAPANPATKRRARFGTAWQPGGPRSLHDAQT